MRISKLALLSALAVALAACASPTAEEAGASADAVSAPDVLDRIPKNTWVPQGTRRGSRSDATGVAEWDVYVTFGEAREPYVVALGRSEAGAAVVDVVIDATTGDMDLRSGIDKPEEERAAWLAAIGEDLRQVSAAEEPPGTSPRAFGRPCGIAAAWAVLHAAGFAASGALTFEACATAGVTGVVSGGLTVTFCIWQASETVDLAAETARRLRVAYEACR